MRLGILSDAHGNLAGLEACLRFLQRQGVEEYLFLGDAVGYFPQSAAVCDLLARLPATVIAGNHEAMLLEILPMSGRMRDVIRPPAPHDHRIRRWLRRCEQAGPMRTAVIDGKRLLLAHGSPADPYCGRIGDAAQVPSGTFDILLVGHTHHPQIMTLADGRLLINPGSCGYPRDNGAWLSVAVLDTVSMAAQIYRLPNRLDTAILNCVHPSVRNTLQRDFPFLGRRVENL